MSRPSAPRHEESPGLARAPGAAAGPGGLGDEALHLLDSHPQVAPQALHDLDATRPRALQGEGGERLIRVRVVSVSSHWEVTWSTCPSSTARATQKNAWQPMQRATKGGSGRIGASNQPSLQSTAPNVFPEARVPHRWRAPQRGQPRTASGPGIMTLDSKSSSVIERRRPRLRPLAGAGRRTCAGRSRPCQAAHRCSAECCRP